MTKAIKAANELILLWRQFGPNTDHVDLKELFYGAVLPKASGTKCEIIEEEFDTFEGIMALDKKLGEWRIGINTSVNFAPRRNFTLAHEIAHFICHRELRDGFFCSFENLTDYQNCPLEIEANEFAAHLLMPPDRIRELTKDRPFDHENVEELAEIFRVSKSALAYRWVKLADRPIGFAISRDGMIKNGRASDSLYRRGTFFRSGSEIPESAKVFDLVEPGDQSAGTVGSGVWNEAEDCNESSFAATREGYVYTYLDFAA